MNADEKTSHEPARWKRAGDESIRNLSHLVRRCFKRDGHHVRFNVVAAEALRATRADLDARRDLIVRVAG